MFDDICYQLSIDDCSSDQNDIEFRLLLLIDIEQKQRKKKYTKQYKRIIEQLRIRRCVWSAWFARCDECLKAAGCRMIRWIFIAFGLRFGGFSKAERWDRCFQLSRAWQFTLKWHQCWSWLIRCMTRLILWVCWRKTFSPLFVSQIDFHRRSGAITILQLNIILMGCTVEDLLMLIDSGRSIGND